jgi:uncharacterized HAD superfamily protein
MAEKIIIINMEKAICFDLDGVLAYGCGREWEEYDKVKYDIKDDFMSDLISRFQEYQILIATARSEGARKETEKWLKDNKIFYNQLWMRKEDTKEYLTDEDVKYGIYNKYIKNKYDVWAVFDDSHRCCTMWKDLGLKVLQII